MNRVVVLVPSWAPLSPEMEAETGAKYPAFIPLGGEPLHKHIIAQYRRGGDHIRIVFLLAQDAPELIVDVRERVSVEVLRLRASESIGETVLAGLTTISAGDAVVVNMADTLVGIEALPAGNAVYVQSRSDLYRWTSVSVDSLGHVKVTNDRKEIMSFEARPVCVGLFSFEDGGHLAAVLSSALKSGAPGREPLLVALENYSSSCPMDLRSIDRWMDCGHIDGYYESRLSYQNLRHFNTLSYDPVRGQVTKKSRNAEAFRKQVRWFKEIPEEVGPYVPRIFASSDGNDPFITMELLSIPTLGELFVSQRLNLGAWNDVVRAISCIQSCFTERAVTNSLACELARVVYIEKTRSRLESFVAKQPSTERCYVRFRGERWSVGRVQEVLSRFVEQSGLLDIDELTPIHGDFCFSNLLYDPKVRLVKMIDPRGEFGVPGIFGDRRYDLAKLAHSYAGKYDFIVADQFVVNAEADGRLQLLVHTGDYFNRVKEIFDTVLLSDAELRQQVYALQALLFLSMLPLHADKPRRQLAMLTTGLELFAEAWNTWSVR